MFPQLSTAMQSQHQQQQQHPRYQDVKCPFRVRVPAGESTFTVPVPQSYCDRSFYFSKLTLSPDYFNQQAANFNQDLDEELDSTVDDFSLYMTIGFNVDKLYDKRYDQDQKENTPRTIGALIKDINNYFEVNKPTGMIRSPFFLDWTDIDLQDSVDSVESVVKATGDIYYDEAYDEAKHGNVLPPSVADLPGVNNTLFPSGLTANDPTRDKIRIRMHCAPQTKATFSTNSQLRNMGFTEEDIGRRVARRPIVVKNPDEEYAVLQASQPPDLAYSWIPASLTKLSVLPLSETWVSPEVDFTKLRRKDERINTSLAIYIKKAVDMVAAWSNWNFSFFYNSDSTFQFGFPNNVNARATMHMTPSLAMRMGYGLNRQITSSSVPQPVPEMRDIKESERMSLALVYDTGLVVVSLSKSSSNTTSNIDNQFMASLEPEPPGVLKMAYNCESTSLVQVPFHKTGSCASAFVTFDLSRFNEAGIPIPFAWKTGAYVNGTFTGLPPPTRGGNGGFGYY